MIDRSEATAVSEGQAAPRTAAAPPGKISRIAGLVKIARIDHWIKNVFVLPGVVVAMGFEPWHAGTLLLSFVCGMLSVCLIASSNYTLNEVLDAPFDRFHPVKCFRPIPSGEVGKPLAYLQWIVLMLVGLAVALAVSTPFAVTMFILWIMGCVYNIPPVRSKDKPYLDVLSESINNPLRLLAGWYIVGASVIPSAALLLSYWMVGCYFMAIKRYAELRDIGSAQAAASYRRSFRYYTLDRLLISIMFYGSAAMLFFGAFTIRYRFELILAYPLVAIVMAVYLQLGLKPHSAAQAPEKLYREPLLMVSVVVCAVALAVLTYVDIPWVRRAFEPTMRTGDRAGDTSAPGKVLEAVDQVVSHYHQ